MGEPQQKRRQRVAQDGGVQAERQRGRVLVLAPQVFERGAQPGELRRVGTQQRRQVVAVEAGGLHGRARQEARLHGQHRSAVLARPREAVDLPRADPQQVPGRGLVLGEVDHVPDRALGEQHHDMEVDAVHALQRRVGVPGAAGAHRADLHADTADAQLDREGERSDPVAALDGSVCHVRLVPPRSRAVLPVGVPLSPQAGTRRPSVEKVRLLVLKTSDQLLRSYRGLLEDEHADSGQLRMDRTRPACRRHRPSSGGGRRPAGRQRPSRHRDEPGAGRLHDLSEGDAARPRRPRMGRP